MTILTGLNHLTLAVSDVERSLHFYSELLGFRVHASWAAGAYLSLGDLWLCLSLDSSKRPPSERDYTHYAFSIAEGMFSVFLERLRDYQVVEWKENKSEGDSAYFLDPDGHKLEAHVGNLHSRLSHCRDHPYQNMRFFD